MMTRPTVLLGEDSSMVLMATEFLLEEHDLQVIATASSLESALEQARSTTPDIVLLDVNLFGEMSFPVADVLVERGIPFIFTTGYSANESIPSRFAATPVMHKPYDEGALMVMVGQLLAATSPRNAP